MEPSATEAAKTLRTIEQQRWQMRQRAALPVWVVCAALTVILVGLGLIDDLAPSSSGVIVMSLFAVGLVVGLVSRTRWGSALWGRRPLARSWIIGVAEDGSARSQRVVFVVWLLVAAVLFAETFRHVDEPVTAPLRGHPFGNTIAGLVVAVVGSVGYIAYRRWLASKAGRS